MSDDKIVWRGRGLTLKQHKSEIPWFILYCDDDYKEFSQVPRGLRVEICDILVEIENEMLEHLSPTKINIASFGNQYPKVHWHIMARYENDSYYPEPMWGQKQREGSVDISNIDKFIEKLQITLIDRSLIDELD